MPKVLGVSHNHSRIVSAGASAVITERINNIMRGMGGRWYARFKGQSMSSGYVD